MDKPLVTIKYRTADGNTIDVDVSAEVADVIEETDRKIRSQTRQDRRRHTEYIDGMTDILVSHPSQDLVDLVEQRDNLQRLYAAMEALTAVQKRRLHLYYFEGLTYREIGKREGVGHKSAFHSVEQAIKKLRTYFVE